MTSETALPGDWEQLVTDARRVRQLAYAPYSQFQVGAAIRMDDGRVFVGCNVENSSYGLTICAERVAMCSAVAAGVRSPQVICISLTGRPSPCGSCRQFLYEFNPDLIVLLDSCDTAAPPDCVVLRDLLPQGFRLDPDD